MRDFVRGAPFRVIAGIQILLQAATLVDLINQRQMRRSQKWKWGMIISTFGYGGLAVYWLLGRPKQSRS